MNPNPHMRGVVTLAYGPRRFVEQARSLAHSLIMHAPRLPRTLVTDSKDPKILKLFTEVVAYRPEFGSGVRQKLYLDLYSPYEETLFIDSDCLVLGNLESFWTAFAGQDFGVPGYRYQKKGDIDPYLDLDHVLDTLNVASLPKFNGGVYYFARTPQATNFFNTARNLLDNASSLRLYEFRKNGPADEAVYSAAMAVHQIPLTSMGTGGMWTPCGYKGSLHLDVAQGTCSFEKDGMMVTPEVIHFPGEYVYAFPYARERAKLKALIEGNTTSGFRYSASYVKSVLWQCSRRSSGLSRIARSCVRTYRRAVRAFFEPTRSGLPVTVTDIRGGLRE